jgi:hypothetical protein
MQHLVLVCCLWCKRASAEIRRSPFLFRDHFSSFLLNLLSISKHFPLILLFSVLKLICPSLPSENYLMSFETVHLELENSGN